MPTRIMAATPANFRDFSQSVKTAWRLKPVGVHSLEANRQLEQPTKCCISRCKKPIQKPTPRGFEHLPSGKRLHNYGTSPCLMGKPTISMAVFHSYFDITIGQPLTWSLGGMAVVTTSNLSSNPPASGMPNRQGFTESLLKSKRKTPTALRTWIFGHLWKIDLCSISKSIYIYIYIYYIYIVFEALDFNTASCFSWQLHPPPEMLRQSGLRCSGHDLCQ